MRFKHIPDIEALRAICNRFSLCFILIIAVFPIVGNPYAESLAETYYDVIGDQVILRGYAGQYERFNEETGDPYYTYDVDHEAVTEEEYENAVNQYSTGKYTEYGYHTYQMYGIETYAGD